MKTIRPLWLAFVCAGAALISTTAARADTNSTAYLFTYFVGNGEDGLHLAWSRDGYRWKMLNGGKSYLAPTVGKSKLMRDPCIVCGPDGTFHMVWTSGWTENNIGYASSKDLITWSAEKEIPVMAHEPTVRNCWAPEIDWDDKRGEFIIFWASTIPEKFTETAGASENNYNHRLYYTTTKDFVTFAPTKLFYDPGFSVIDATFLHANGRHYLIVKDETRTPPKKHLRIAVANDLQGPFADLSPPFTPQGRWAEGPTAIKIGDEFVVYYDAYREHHYSASRSRDLKTWEDVTAQMTFVPGMRHGTVIAVPRELVDKLIAAAPAPATTPSKGQEK